MGRTYVHRALAQAAESLSQAEGGLFYAAYGEGSTGRTKDEREAIGHAQTMAETAERSVAAAIKALGDTRLPFVTEGTTAKTADDYAGQAEDALLAAAESSADEPHPDDEPSAEAR